MTAAEKKFEEIAEMADAEVMPRLAGMTGRELEKLHRYALSHEDGERRDGVLIWVMMEAGARYLAEQVLVRKKDTQNL